MAENTAPPAPTPIKGQRQSSINLSGIPWWLLILFLIIAWVLYFVLTDANYSEAFNFIVAGIELTITTTLIAYTLAMVLGCIAGLGRVSRNVIINNIATFYVEVIRGIPILVLIFYIAFVGVPSSLDFFTDTLGLDFITYFEGLASWEPPDVDMDADRNIWQTLGLVIQHPRLIINFGAGLFLQLFEMQGRAIIALAVTYGAYLAEIFRAGIQSIGRGQMEAARSLGMSYTQAMRYIILPQAVRNVLPALGNDFVAMLKDSSLVSVLAVRDLTQLARIYAGSSFRFREAYTVLAILYLSMTVVLSLAVQFVERRMRTD